MTIENLKKTLAEFNLTSAHDYEVDADGIKHLGIDEGDLEDLRPRLGREWRVIQKRRNPENGFLRVDIIKD